MIFLIALPVQFTVTVARFEYKYAHPCKIKTKMLKIQIVVVLKCLQDREDFLSLSFLKNGANLGKKKRARTVRAVSAYRKF